MLYTGNYIPSLGRDFELVCGVEFLALLVPHIALRWEARIHTYGAISTRVRKELGWIAEETRPETPNEVVVAEEDSEFVKIRRRSWARLIATVAKVYKEDPILCRSWGTSMRLVSAITFHHQDDVIEILKARGEWNTRGYASAGPAPHRPSSRSSRPRPATSTRSSHRTSPATTTRDSDRTPKTTSVN